VFSTIRVYAISGGTWWLAALTLALGLVPVGTNIDYGFVTSADMIQSAPLLGTFCGTNQIASEATIIGLTTTTRTYAIARTADRSGIRAPLASMLLKDGTLYFALLLVVNILQIIGNNTGIFTGTVGFFGQPLSGIIVSRFLMNLRQLNHTSSNTVGDQQSDGYTMGGEGPGRSQFSSMRFASLVGNMGEELDHGFECTAVGGGDDAESSLTADRACL